MRDATIRRAEADDAPQLARVAERTFRATFAADNDAGDMELHCAERFGADIQRREILDPGGVTLLAERAGELLGFAQLRLRARKGCVEAGNPSELYRIYVVAEWHGRGVAPMLMEHALEAAAAAGSDVVWLGVWERNARALAFYRKFGFRVVGEHIFRFGTDDQTDLVMAVALGDAGERR